VATWLITWSLKNRWTVLAAATLVAAVGIWSLGRLNFDAFPDTTPVQVQINTPAPSMTPEEIERLITFPVELAISGLPGLQQVRSVSQFGASAVIATFDDDVDIFFARQVINERLSAVQVPDGIDRPQMGPVATGLGEVFHYILTSDKLDLQELRTAHDWVVKPKMRTVPGVAEVNSWGGLEKQYQVRIDPLRLIRLEISFDEVVDAIHENNLNVGGGNINENRSGEMLLVQGVGRTTNVAEIENVVILEKDNIPIRVRDVADVTIGHEIRRGAVTAGGEGEVVLGLGFMLMGENSYAVTRRLKDKLDEVRRDLPPELRIDTVYDRTRLVDQVIATVRSNLCDGALLVTAIVFVFLGNLRAGLIVALAIPLSMLFAFTGMQRMGIAGTLLSLGAIDFGVVVDSSLVVVENVLARLAHGGRHVPRLSAIRDAAIEVRQPTVFGQLIIMIVYIPILTLEGVEGKMFGPMAWTVIFVLLGSLILSLTVIPVLCSFLLPKQPTEHEPLLVRLATAGYRPVLGWAMRLKPLVLGAALASLAVAAYLGLGMGTEFVPRLSEGDLVIGILRPPGTDLSEATRLNSLMEQKLRTKFPDEISHLWSRTGAPEVATDAGDVQITDMFVSLTPRTGWRQAKTQNELVEKIQQVVGNYPGQITWFTQPIEQRINEMVSGVRADVALKLFGDDFEKLVATATAIERGMRDVPGCEDLAVEQLTGQPILRVKVRQDQIARYGVPAEAVLDLVEAIGSKPLGEIVEGQLRFPLAARLPDSLRFGPETISSILLLTPSGERLPLSLLADVERVSGPKMIPREWGKRRITVQCNVRGRDIGSFIADARERITAGVSLPNGYSIEWGGQFENMQRAQQRLAIVVPAALVLILGLLYLTYRNLIDVLCVFASVPFACVGGVLALWYRELPISISAAVGFITLSGVSVLNSMVVITVVRESRTSVEAAWLSRLRTIMMTTLVAAVGFVPMAISDGVGAEVQRPLATVVIGGVFSSTMMTLLVLPVLYSAIRRQET
jgi:cobalt-zinc-cadmium resistance protein CzcA